MAKSKSKERLETELAKAQLEALKVRMNPHFISNALTSIRSMLYRDEKEAAIDYLTMFARLIRKTLENASLEFISLSDETEYIRNYLEIEKIRFGGKFETSIILPAGITASEIQVPPNIFQPFIENSINHGLMHMTSGGILTIRFEFSDKHLKCTIEDNGVGRERAKQLRTNSLSKGTSVAEKITLDRLELYNKLYKTSDFTIRTTDLTGIQGKPSGTRVEIQLPLFKISEGGGQN